MMHFSFKSLLISFFVLFIAPAGQVFNQGVTVEDFHRWAPVPPMGWNSWDCYGPTVTEEEVKANADFMAKHLKDYGWEYIVVDIRWYVGNDKSHGYNETNPDYFMDDFGRFIPAVNRFPSSAGGKGFKPLADYIHDRGLKFGIHVMRGIPKIAVERNLPITESKYRAKDIYSNDNLCTWLHDMYTIDAAKQGAQDYYNSLFRLYASWGIDFVKIDDLSSPYHADEIEMIRKAIDNCGRKIVLSTSPGETPVNYASHIQQHANMWRIVGDFWDNWPQLKEHFEICNRWAPFIGYGAYPDADMLPLGHIGIRAERGNDRMSQLTRDEQYTLMTLFSVFRSPLMFGGDLPTSDSFTISLLTNKNVLMVNKTSTNNRQLFKEKDIVAWTADDPVNGGKYLALFNIADQQMIVKEKALWKSGIISKDTPGHGIEIDVDITGAEKLYLTVTDGGDNIDWDHADWIMPLIYNSSDTLRLTSMKWEKATAGWGEVRVNKSVSGGELIVNNKKFTEGIGTHSSSVIAFNIPPGYNRFKAFAGLDKACVVQQAGATVEFMVFTQNPAGPPPPDSVKVTVKLSQLGLAGEFLTENLWTGEVIGLCKDEITTYIKPHASVFYRLKKK